MPANSSASSGSNCVPARASRDRDGGLDPVSPMEDLDHVGEVHEPRGDEDLVALQPLGHAAAVPALEGLLDRVADEAVERSRSIMSSDARQWFSSIDSASRLPWPRNDGRRPTRRRSGKPAAEMPEHEHRPRSRVREIGPAEVALQHHLVPEPLRLLVGIDVAADPRDQGAEVDGLALAAREADPVGERQRDQALPQHMLHRLAHPQVDAEGQDAEQLGQPDPTEAPTLSRRRV